MYILLALLVLTSTDITAGYNIMPHDPQHKLKPQALDLLQAGLPSSSSEIDNEFYEGVLSPIETGVTNAAEGPSYEDVAPFSAMYDKEFKDSDEIFNAADKWSLWQRDQNDQGPGTKQYKENDPVEQARMFGKLLQGQLKKDDNR